MTKNEPIDSFEFQPGRVLARKYEVVTLLGAGWEGEVYRLKEKRTGIERAAKFFFPHRNPKEKLSKIYAKKLHKLRKCDAIIQYHTEETISFRRQELTFLVSEYVEGELLSSFLKRQRGGRIGAFEGLHLLYALTKGMEPIHALREYHGDLHPGNIFIKRNGLGFDVKLIDFFHWDTHLKNENIRDDVYDLVRLFYDAIGGSRYYSKHPQVVRDVCCGLRKTSIWKKYRTGGQLRRYLEALEWT
ncbi:MAG: protein kinase [Bdellovibrionales bacterium]|nr:protein kinase [Bdellovibrionales bacterium]